MNIIKLHVMASYGIKYKYKYKLLWPVKMRVATRIVL